ncbi:DNA methyltransferase [uncultured Victivallis sp.]|uniref:DNA methyltransferase n=1 Tax=uncultured Victivallis sp. TaxID=354118 RepID=UPI00345DEF00
MTGVEQRTAAAKFAADWRERGYEKGESQPFWLALLRNVFGVSEPEKFIFFENQVQLEHTSFIDAYIPETRVMIEQKGRNVDLLKPAKQSDGQELTPFRQAKRYADELEYSRRPRWIVVCNFQEFHVHDMERPHIDPEIIRLADLPKEYHRLSFLTQETNAHLKREMELSIQAGEIVGRLYDEILKHYNDPAAESSLKSLNKLCVRLVFCLYAEDAGIFARRNQFHDYLAQFEPRFLRRALIDLFQVLDTEPGERDPYLEDELAAFPYVNGGLFADEAIEIPQLDETVKNLLLMKASDDFDWSDISPTIFGALFESTLNPDTRRSGGMHYTSIENIHKVIDPLFLNDLKNEFAEIRSLKVLGTRNRRLLAFQEKLSSLTFLDPACGSGNFLTETYLSLRQLENEVLELLNKDGHAWLTVNPIRVSIQQFFGIEINDFAVSVAKTALWIAESQMMKATEEIVHSELDFLPLKSYVNIVEGNALQMEWESVVPQNRLNYIMGNPPFVGARIMSAEQKADLQQIFADTPSAGNLDYVCCWYRKAVEMMRENAIRAALVSTNSITQGEQVALLWKPLFEHFHVHIDFAHRTFRWDSEASIKAHVHCVIVGFSVAENPAPKRIFDSAIGPEGMRCSSINAYLVDAPDVFIPSRSIPLCDVPEIGIGNKPIDGGNYLFTEAEKEAFVKKEPAAAKFFRPWFGSEEFINRRSRYCLWLGECSPRELHDMPECLARVEAVRLFRLASKSPGTRKLADRPTRFHVENMPDGNYILIPEVSSERRYYVPMGFMSPDTLCSNLVKLVPDATRYHFGILTSLVHMAWMRAVCGRLETRYRYSKDIVYNNFPWPEASAGDKEKIGVLAQAILDARALFPDCTLADLYDQTTMPPELRKAHQENDKAVMRLYGFPPNATEPEIVAKLMRRYQELTASA